RPELCGVVAKADRDAPPHRSAGAGRGSARARAGAARVQPEAAVHGLRRWCPPEEAASEPPRTAVAHVSREEGRVSADVQGDGAELGTVGGSTSQPPARWRAPSTSCTEGRRR